MTKLKTIDIVIPVYNDDSYLLDCIESLLSQELPNNWSMSVFVVDDGSSKPIRLKENGNIKKWTSLIRHPVNKGRSAACNTGVSAGSSEYIYILDSDCVLRERHVLSQHINKLTKEGFDISCGNIFKHGDDFWARYQGEVADKRARAYEMGMTVSFTTANCMISRDAFVDVGGFDDGFTKCGFEDRELLLRLYNKNFKIGHCQSGAVEHMCDLTLTDVAGKLYTGGAYSSTRFIEKHLGYYKKMHFAKADVRFFKSLNILSLMTEPLTWPLIKGVDWAINKQFLPYFVEKALVKSLSGLAYLHGTRKAI